MRVERRVVLEILTPEIIKRNWDFLMKLACRVPPPSEPIYYTVYLDSEGEIEFNTEEPGAQTKIDIIHRALTQDYDAGRCDG